MILYRARARSRCCKSQNYRANQAGPDKTPGDEKAAILCAIASANLGPMEDAREMANLAEKTVNDSNGRYNLACIYARLGEKSCALDLLEISVPEWPSIEWPWVWEDPDLASLHDEPHFLAIREKLAV
jgi:adenylate cyclase